MTRFMLVSALFIAGVTFTVAQGPTTETGQPVQNQFFNTGVQVGKPVLTSVGKQFKAAAPNAGSKVGNNPGNTWKTDPLPPGGQLINLKNSVGPVPAASLPPILRPQESPSIFEQVYAKWASAIGITKPAVVNGGYVPGMTRRAKERRDKANWWND